ncbi:hypothetical protein BDV98DRAFT_145368 [Pterulicium gracile]|uniref:Uncharacterized protein n=1 Tax=Pterulicium gracile TaxID=1884261 RepID=A0A5C3QWK0_9AGAR|nr:hypothetical protein BDV98DRAFT_145368 [Pterula gracilis]
MPITDEDLLWSSSLRAVDPGFVAPRRTGYHDRSSSIASYSTVASTSSSTSTANSSTFPRTPSDSSSSLLCPPSSYVGGKSILTRSASKSSASSTVKSVKFAEIPTVYHEVVVPSERRSHSIDEEMDEEEEDWDAMKDLHAYSSSSAAVKKPSPKDPRRRSLKHLISGQRPSRDITPARPEISRPLALGSMLPPPSSGSSSTRSLKSSSVSSEDPLTPTRIPPTPNHEHDRWAVGRLWRV